MFNFNYCRLMGISVFSGRRVCTRSLLALLLLALMLVFFTLGIYPVQAEEEPQLEWESIFGWQGYRGRVVAVAQSVDGGYMVVVEKRLDVDWRSDTYVTVSACVVKIDASGKKVWEKVLVEDCGWVGEALQTADGGLIIGLSTKLTDQFLHNITVIKIDASGNEEWEKTFGGEIDDYMTSLERTSDGGYFIVGSSKSFNTRRDYDVYLIKLNASGEKIWEKTYGGIDNDAGQVVRDDGDSGCFIVGRTISCGNGSVDDVYLVKTDAYGNKVWEKVPGSRGQDKIAAVQRTTDGGLVIVGTKMSYPDWEYVYLVKVDASGERNWEKIFGRDEDFYDYGVSVRETKEGGFIVLGDTGPFGDGRSVLLIKTDAFGDKVWESTFHDKEHVWSSGVEQSGDGYIIFGKEYDQYGSNIYVIKADSEGNKLWKRTFGNSVWRTSTVSMLLTSDGACIIAGTVLKGHDKYGYINDIYIAKLGLDKTIQEEIGSQAIAVYLNGNQLFFDVPPIIEDGRTLAPLRAIGEALGADVAWEGQTQTITLEMAATKIELKIGDPVAYVNGEAVMLDVPAKIMDGRTLVPLRFVGEYFGAGVQWDGVKRVIIIET